MCYTCRLAHNHRLTGVFMVETKYYDLEQIFASENEHSVMGKVSDQLMRLHRLALTFDQPVILECGVNQGWSTGIFAHACEQNGGQLISVDINDCSDAIVSDCWTFIQSDDSDQDYVFSQAPVLKDGIDIIYIDSLHAAGHVRRLLENYYPYINQGGYIAVDDVDPGPYMAGRRKDDAEREIAWRRIGDVVRDFFYSNEDDLKLEMHYGSTGLAIITKLVPAGQAASFQRSPRRYFTLRSFVKSLLGRQDS